MLLIFLVKGASNRISHTELTVWKSYQGATLDFLYLRKDFGSV